MGKSTTATSASYHTSIWGKASSASISTAATSKYGFAELDELVLAYATTIHESQGSEYPAVVIPLTTQHYPMLQRNLVYTGVTRGKRLAEEGARYCGQGESGEAAVVEAAGVANRR